MKSLRLSALRPKPKFPTPRDASRATSEHRARETKRRLAGTGRRLPGAFGLESGPISATLQRPEGPAGSPWKKGAPRGALQISRRSEDQLPVALSTEIDTPGPMVELSETFFM